MKKFIWLNTLVISLVISMNTSYLFGQVEEYKIFAKDKKFNTWTLAAGFGPSIFYGDVVDYTLFPSNNYKFAYGVSVSKHFAPALGVELNAIKGELYGNKSFRHAEADYIQLYVSSTASINQLVEQRPWGDRWDVYVKAGLGAMFFRSKVLANYTVKDPTSGQVFNEGDVLANFEDNENRILIMSPTIGYTEDGTEKTPRKSSVVFPLGVGTKYRINRSFDAGMELMLNNMSADNLDLSLTGADNDSYMTVMFNLGYKFGKKNKRHLRWTYRDFSFNILSPYSDVKNGVDTTIIERYTSEDTVIIIKEQVNTGRPLAISVFFNFNGKTVDGIGMQSIAKVAAFLLKDTAATVQLIGHCDEKGSEEYNFILAIERCETVKEILIENFNIHKNRIRYITAGENLPLLKSKKVYDMDIHVVNRRVDFIIKNETIIDNQ